MHKLSAVLFADIAGYTAMMQEDEKTALQLINKFKKVKTMKKRERYKVFSITT